MIIARAPQRLPVRLRLESEGDAWGRLEAVSPAGCRLTTLAALERGGELRLSFELAGEAFTDLVARVAYCRVDDDGFREAELDFPEPLARRRLAQLLVDVFSRA